jgi:hypothetical protein
MKKKLPEFKTDAEAEAFVDEADLSQYDLSGMKPVSWARSQAGAWERSLAKLKLRPRSS